MALITADELKEYTGNYETSTLAATYIAAAEAVVKDFLGYDPASTTYTSQYLDPTNAAWIRAKARPVTALSALSIDSVPQTHADYRIDDDTIIRVDGKAVFSGAIVATYVAGYASNAIPGALKMACLRIAALLMQEAAGNIGVMGKSLPDGQSRTFVNYTNFSKYLEPLSSLRIHRW